MDRFEQPVTPTRRSSGSRWRLAVAFAAAAAITTVIAVRAAVQPAQPAPGPSASIALASPLSSTMPSAVPAPPASPTVGPTASPAPTRTPAPTYAPEDLARWPSWRISIYGVTALIVDPAGRVVGAAPAAMRFFTLGFSGGVLPADDDHAVDVYWQGSVCAAWETVTLDAGGRITVNTTLQDTVCEPGPSMRGLELRFAERVAASDFSLVVGEERRYPSDLMPVAASFADATHGVVAMANGVAAVAETADGGQSWRLSILGDGEPTGVALVGDTAWASIACDPSQQDHCRAGVYRRDPAGWTRVHAMDPGPMAVYGATIAVLDASPRPTSIALSRDGGATWSTIPVPCSVGHATGIAVVVELEVVCQAAAYADGSADKALWVSQGDDLSVWVQQVLPDGGADVAISAAENGTVVLWGTQTPPLVGWGGGTWTESPVADGRTRTVRYGRAEGDGVITLLVLDKDRRATLLLRTADGGAHWTEIASFRDLPCCGG